jgi:UDP-N-acetylglucosamine--N-acetylmuramyl-(pentapeptide) pyrophosphoryl-undecaprenol N-acetylglucosamine transferase
MNDAIDSSQKPEILVFVGGGTGGHLFPAIAIADEVQRMKPDARISFIGTKNKIESRVVPERGYAFDTIWISGFTRSLTLKNLLFPLKVLVSLVQSYSILRRLRPSVVVGTGGFVTGPVVYMATLMGIPTLIQEQNSYPGVTTRLLARRVREVHLTFEGTKRYLKTGVNAFVSGNPVRKSIGSIPRAEGLREFSLSTDKPVMLVLGGSLGAASINRAVESNLAALMELGMQIVWQTGTAGYERCAASAGRWSDSVRVQEFIERMEYAYAAADFALCRAGATTVAELTLAGIPSVLVPYPHAAADHQTENARALVNGGAAVMIKDAEVEGQIVAAIRPLAGDAQKRKAMGGQARRLAHPGASTTIASAAIALAQS